MLSSISRWVSSAEFSASFLYLTTFSGVLDKLIVSLVPYFCITRGFITLFTTARHWILSWAIWTQSTPSHPVSLKSVVMLSSQKHVGPMSGLVPSGFSTKISYASHRFHACYVAANLILLGLITVNNAWWMLRVVKYVLGVYSFYSHGQYSLRSWFCSVFRPFCVSCGGTGLDIRNLCLASHFLLKVLCLRPYCGIRNVVARTRWEFSL
jgi:hypothetical protein